MIYRNSVNSYTLKDISSINATENELNIDKN